MAEKHQCEFFLLRYVPDAVRNEFVNIGVLLVEADAGFADIRLTKDWRRVRCLDSDVDVEMLEAIGREVGLRLADVTDRDLLMRKLEESLSNVVQLSASKGCLTDDPRKELEELALLYVDTKKAGEKRGASGRQKVFSAMRASFVEAGVWPHMRQEIEAAQYTQTGDLLKVDCGYRPNGVVKLFHAISLTHDPNVAKVLAYSFPKIAEGIQRNERATTSLTVVVEDDFDASAKTIEFAEVVLKQSGIQRIVVSEMPAIAEFARRELHL